MSQLREISEGQISESWTSLLSDGPMRVTHPRAEIYLAPVVKVEEDKKYEGWPVPFDLKVQDYLSTTAWGKNYYTARTGSREVQFEIQQSK